MVLTFKSFLASFIGLRSAPRVRHPGSAWFPRYNHAHRWIFGHVASLFPPKLGGPNIHNEKFRDGGLFKYMPTYVIYFRATKNDEWREKEFRRQDQGSDK